MDLRAFSTESRIRCEAPNGFNHKITDWSLSDWTTATLGELGEAANVVKKLNRVRDGIPGNTISEQELQLQLARELADTFIYLDLLAQSQGIDLGLAVIAAFNMKSTAIGYPILLGPGAEVLKTQAEIDKENGIETIPPETIDPASVAVQDADKVAIQTDESKVAQPPASIEEAVEGVKRSILG